METIFAFLLKASAGMAIFYLVYWLFLNKETFYEANRWFLVLALIFSVLLPLFPLQYLVLVEPEKNRTVFETISDTFKNIPVVKGSEIENSGIRWQQAVLLVYLTGAAIFLFRLLVQTFILIQLMIKYSIKSLDGVRIVENEKYGLPFSFFNIVFINPKFHTQDDLPEILAHEKVHIRENHWFDLLFIELLTVIFWFNPFIWFFERSIKQNHEYLADRGVLAQGHGVGRYQAILLNQLMGMQIIGVTNNLNFALNTNRLKMMTKTKTSRWIGIKFAWALPAVALLLFAFAEPSYQVGNSGKPENEVVKKETNSGKKLKIQGKVVHRDTGKPVHGASVIIRGTTIGAISDENGSFSLEDPNPTPDEKGFLSSEVVVSFVGLKSEVARLGASGSAVDKAKYTIKMEDAVILIDNNSLIDAVPSPPPPKETTKGEKLMAPPPPPLPSASGEKEVFYIVEDLPKYPGGHTALNEYVSKMQQKLMQGKGIKGKAKVAFTINGKGKVTDIKIVEQDNDGVGKGAAMIASGMEDWTPGKQRGKPVSVKYLLPVEFK